MGQILWSEAAAGVMKRLDPALRAAIEQRMSYLQQTPRMYARVDDTRFPGCRSFWVEGVCHVYYMVAAGGDDCYIMAVEAVAAEEGLSSAGGFEEHEL